MQLPVDIADLHEEIATRLEHRAYLVGLVATPQTCLGEQRQRPRLALLDAGPVTGLQACAQQHHGPGDVAHGEGEVSSSRDGIGEPGVVADRPVDACCLVRPRDGLRIAPDADLDAAARQVTTLSDGPERFEMLAALLAVIGNARGQQATDRLVEEITAADERFSDWPSERLRGRLALGWFQILGLRGGLGAATHTEAYHQARRRHDHECVLALGGAAGMSQALTGQITAAVDTSASHPGDPQGRGWMRLDELRRATHAAALCYTGQPAQAADELQALEEGGARDGPEPITMLLLRLGRLVDETHGRNGSARVLETWSAPAPALS